MLSFFLHHRPVNFSKMGTDCFQWNVLSPAHTLVQHMGKLLCCVRISHLCMCLIMMKWGSRVVYLIIYCHPTGICVSYFGTDCCIIFTNYTSCHLQVAVLFALPKLILHTVALSCFSFAHTSNLFTSLSLSWLQLVHFSVILSLL
jgi:hypothetical protein